MTEAAVATIFMLISIGTFMLQGKQWPTFVTAAIAFTIIGHVSGEIGSTVTDKAQQAAAAVSSIF